MNNNRSCLVLWFGFLTLFLFIFHSVSKSTEKLNSLIGESVKPLADQLKDAIKNSCETIITGFEDLANPTSDKTGSGGSSAVPFSLSFILLVAALLCLKMHF
jgi:hypothetical protein